MMTRSIISFLAIVTILSACAPAMPSPTPLSAMQETPTPSTIPSFTPRPSQTLGPTLTSLLSRTPGPTQTSSITPTGTLSRWTEIYPTKQALVIYGVSARTQMTQMFMNRGDFYFNPFIMLYADGQLIFGPGFYEKQLSLQEADAILEKLIQLGFFQIQDTYARDEQNPIYTFPDGKAPSLSADPNAITITVNGKETKTVRYMAEWEQYLNQPLKDIVAYLESFPSEGTTPYQPDRLLVGIVILDETIIPENATIIPWPHDITPPSQSSRYDVVLYLKGTEAIKLYDTVAKNPYAYFIYDGIKFDVYLRPILPNECHIYHYHYQFDSRQPDFTCDDW